MNIMHDTFDLNLVRVFLAVWRTRSVTAAAEALHLTQPAISHALRRLRDLFDDPLFVRSGKRMTPTHLATSLHGPLERAYETISNALQDNGTFAPELSRRRFKLAMSDLVEFHFLPRLLAYLKVAAPHVQIAVTPPEIRNVKGMLRAGDIDVFIGHLPDASGDFPGRSLITDTLICLVRAGHPAIGKPFDLAAFTALHHIEAPNRAPSHHLVDRRLSELGCELIATLQIGSLSGAPDIIRGTDLAVVYPRSLAEKINEHNAFALLPLPFEIETMHIQAHTHSRYANDAGLLWFVGVIETLFPESGSP